MVVRGDPEKLMLKKRDSHKNGGDYDQGDDKNGALHVMSRAL